jgi:hypothetical protein
MSLLDNAKNAVRDAKNALTPGSEYDTAEKKQINPPKPRGGNPDAEGLLASGTTTGPLADLEKSQGQIRIILPDNLVQMDHWVNIRISRSYKFRSTSERQVKGGPKRQNNSVGYDKKDCKCSIFLPMPQDLKTGYKTNFASEGLGVVGEAAARIGSSEGQGTAESIANELTMGALKNIGLSAVAQFAPIIGGAATSALGGSDVAGITGAAAGGAVLQATQGILAAKGISINPHQAMLFQGVDFRTHTFSYKFMPKTQNETEMLRAFIKVMKYYMAPGFQQGSDRQIFEYPELFDIDFHYNKYLFDIAASHLVSFDVDYHGEGTPSYFGPQGTDDITDVAPTSVTVSMTFQETTITTKEEIARGNR